MQAAFLVASLAFKAIQTGAQNRAIEQQQEARNLQVQREIDELERQQERENEIARERKSDRARELDRAVGTIIAAGADSGATPLAVAAQAGAEGAVAGLDFARIESNRQEGQSARRSASISAIEENRAQANQARQRQRANTIGFFGSAASTVAGFNFASSASGAAATNTAVSTPTTPVARDFQWSGAETF